MQPHNRHQSVTHASSSAMYFLGDHPTPSLSEIREAKNKLENESKNMAPVCREIAADLETPVSAYLKLTAENDDLAYLLESVEGGENLARFSIIGSRPFRVLKTGPKQELKGDPLIHLESEMKKFDTLEFPKLKLPPFSGGAVGYVSYDCVRYFEPTTEKFVAAQKRKMDIPESLFMLCDTIVVFDHVRHSLKIVSHCRLGTGDLSKAYEDAVSRIDQVVETLSRPLPIHSFPVMCGSPRGTSSGSSSAASKRSDSNDAAPSNRGSGETKTRTHLEKLSNVGQSGYENFVRSLKDDISKGNIIQAVPSQRIGAPMPKSTTPFNLYRRLRTINPSPYMFFLRLGGGTFIVGASPEMLCKVDAEGVVETHPIAGTRHRGGTQEEDEALAKELLACEKERAEHIMLVDLGRNDVGRVAVPGSVRVPELMTIVKYSHVQHIVSKCTGKLRADKTIYDAFRSIFPAGTVSGAPKVRAIQLVASLEKERRHIYAGAVGYVSFSGVMDTAIAIRTMVIHDDVAYLQAGGGIVYDSKPFDEYIETINKLAATVRAVEQAGKGTPCVTSPGGARIPHVKRRRLENRNP
eukprot:g2378.t1